MRKFIIGLAVMMFSGFGFAASQGVDQHTLLSCTLNNGKDLVAGYYAGGLRYTYGNYIHPELTLDQADDKSAFTREDLGEGEISATLTFTRGDYQYKVIDSTSHGAGVLVLKNGQYVASFDCDPDTTYSELLGIKY